MNNKIFKPHGKFQVRLEHQILVQEVKGPWNIEMVELWAPKLMPYALELEAAGPWAALVIYHGSLLTSPEAIRRMRDVIAYSTRTFREVACAVAAGPDVEGHLFGASIWEPVYEGLVPFRFFDDAQVAKDWLQMQIDVSVAKTSDMVTKRDATKPDS